MKSAWGIPKEEGLRSDKQQGDDRATAREIKQEEEFDLMSQMVTSKFHRKKFQKKGRFGKINKKASHDFPQNINYLFSYLSVWGNERYLPIPQQELYCLNLRWSYCL